MDINLEKIELVKDRTGATYAEAKEALEKADGSVVDAIIDLEEKMNKEHDAVDGGSLKDSPIFAKMKEIVEKGNVTRILVRKGNKTIVNFPLTAGVIGAALVPWGAILGIIAAVGTQCDIEFVDDKGEVIGVTFTDFGEKGFPLAGNNENYTCWLRSKILFSDLYAEFNQGYHTEGQERIFNGCTDDGYSYQHHYYSYSDGTYSIVFSNDSEYIDGFMVIRNDYIDEKNGFSK